MLRFIHSADLQLGMPFAWAPGDTGARLRRLRLEAVDGLAKLARDRSAGAVLLAGDVFDANDLEDSLAWQACEALGRIPVPVYILPGNHDHLAPVSSVYERPAFRKACPDTVTVLREPEPFAAQAADGTRFLILPAPLRRRREAGDTTAWWRAESGRDIVPDGHRIGLAHGAVTDFSFSREPGSASNMIDPRAAARAQLDYVALGDWHGTLQVGDRTWYSGAPEPTGFVQNDAGNALVVSLESPGAPPQVEKIRVARTTWLDMSAELRGSDDIEALRRRLLAESGSPSDLLVRLRLTGALGMSENRALEELLGDAAARLFLLRLDRDVAAMPSEEELSALVADGWVADAVAALRREAGAGDEKSGAARDALALLHRLLAEARA